MYQFAVHLSQNKMKKFGKNLIGKGKQLEIKLELLLLMMMN
ncbi:hypothetical protein [uncultured Clostridium sp.]|nr:hypothetical protein [uncultured Clostridium sp.]